MVVQEPAKCLLEAAAAVPVSVAAEGAVAHRPDKEAVVAAVVASSAVVAVVVPMVPEAATVVAAAATIAEAQVVLASVVVVLAKLEVLPMVALAATVKMVHR